MITDWNATAAGTIFTDAGKGAREAYLSLGFAQAAVYNAVNGITRRYSSTSGTSTARRAPPRRPQPRRRRTACC